MSNLLQCQYWKLLQKNLNFNPQLDCKIGILENLKFNEQNYLTAMVNPGKNFLGTPWYILKMGTQEQKGSPSQVYYVIYSAGPEVDAFLWAGWLSSLPWIYNQLASLGAAQLAWLAHTKKKFKFSLEKKSGKKNTPAELILASWKKSLAHGLACVSLLASWCTG